MVYIDESGYAYVDKETDRDVEGALFRAPKWDNSWEGHTFFIDQFGQKRVETRPAYLCNCTHCRKVTLFLVRR